MGELGKLKKLAAAAVAGATACVLNAGVATALPDVQCGGANGWSTGVYGAASCPFALNVARAIAPDWVSYQFNVQVYSPVTARNYLITCHDQTAQSGRPRAYLCGVPQGTVYLWQ